jgi:hypothetical protein
MGIAVFRIFGFQDFNSWDFNPGRRGVCKMFRILDFEGFDLWGFHHSVFEILPLGTMGTIY